MLTILWVQTCALREETFCFVYNQVKFLAISLVESRALCMYKTFNMSTNVRSASRTSFVAQFKQLTILLALSWRSKFNALCLQAIKTYTVAEKAWQGRRSWLQLLFADIPRNELESTNTEVVSSHLKLNIQKRVWNWPFAAKCRNWSAKNHTHKVCWLLPARWMHRARVAEKLCVQVAQTLATTRSIYQQTFGFAWRKIEQDWQITAKQDVF